MIELNKITTVKTTAARIGHKVSDRAVFSVAILVASLSLTHAQAGYLTIGSQALRDTTDIMLQALVPSSDLPFDFGMTGSSSGQSLQTAQLATNGETAGEDPSSKATPETNGTNADGIEGSSSEAMPSSLTNPVLPNVPSTIKQSDIVEPPVTTEQKEQITTAPLVEKSTPAVKNTAPIRPGPALRKGFSALFTEQRPFLLYSQDASITYLMPNALVDHPSLGRYLRGILEERALTRWQEIRTNGVEIEGLKSSDSNERPPLVITGRVEDRFYSPAFSSLYLEEKYSIGDKKYPDRILSFNFSHGDQKPFGLSDLFKSDGDKALGATIELIAAYIQADIVRQKTVKFGTPITPDQDSWLKGLKPSVLLFGTFTLVPSRETGKIAGLSFHFNPGLLGAEADGSYNVFVPASIFSPALSPRFADSFGGDALTASRHNAKGFSTASVNIERLKANSELGGNMLIEGEVPGNWCDGFHLTLNDVTSGQIVTEGLVQMLPELPSYGLSGNMIRFRAELSVSGAGGKDGKLVFEPFSVAVHEGRVAPRVGSVCQEDRSISLPDPARDMISIPVTY